MRKGYKKGQSVLEYTLLLAAIIAVIIVVLMGTGGKGGLKGRVQSTYDTIGNAVEATANKVTNIGVYQ